VAQIANPVRGTVIASQWGTTVAQALNVLYAQTGNTVLTTNAAGVVFIGFAAAFPSAPIGVAMDANTWGGTTAPGFIVSAYSIATTSFGVRVYNHDGTPIANGAVRLLWIAIGPRP